MREVAYAKINLALHVRARRDDGYHELETLFAFVDAGDALLATQASEDRLTWSGPFADAMDAPFDNLVMRALNVLPRAGGMDGGLALHLDKQLPVAAGLGGGSADAGAVFRIVRATHGLPDDWRARAERLGADVPACVESVTCIGRGTGATLAPFEGASVAGTPILLVNPRLPLATGPVFDRWDGQDRGSLSGSTAREMALWGRNDLEPAAIALCPEIEAVLQSLRDTSPWLVRMSGSGATCFALYDTATARDEAARGIVADRPDWWTMAGALR